MSLAPEKTETRVDSPPFRFKVGGMDCASCARTIERGLEELDGVEDVTVSFTTETIEGRGQVEPDAVRARVEALGYRIVEDAPPAAAPDELGGVRGFVAFLWRDKAQRLALALGVAVLATSPLLF